SFHFIQIFRITFGPVGIGEVHPPARQRLRECHVRPDWRPAAPANVEGTIVRAPTAHPGTRAVCDLSRELPAADAAHQEWPGFRCMWRAAGLTRPCVRNTIHRDTARVQKRNPAALVQTVTTGSRRPILFPE